MARRSANKVMTWDEIKLYSLELDWDAAATLDQDALMEGIGKSFSEHPLVQDAIERCGINLHRPDQLRLFK